MNFDDYKQYDALGLAELIAKKEVSPAEVLEAAISRAEAVNPKINAIVHTMYGKAREAAHAPIPAGPFAGVPLLIKDLDFILADEPMSHGSVSMRHHIPKQDSYAVRITKEAGLLIFGKTNTPEFGITPYTEPVLFGPARNPWNTKHSTGGSSGGSAAAIAAGIVPLALAADGGGSIRIPASACGVFGMKPSRGRISLGPESGEGWSGLISNFALSKTVRDSATLLDWMQGSMPGDPYIIRTPEKSYADEIKTQPGKLKIAFSLQHPFGEQVHPECEKAVRDTAQLLTDLGHEVEEVPLPYGEEALTKAFFMFVGDLAADLEAMGKLRGRPIQKNEVEITTWLLNILGKSYSGKDVVAGRKEWNTISRRFGQLHTTYDVWMCPTLSKPPIVIGELQNSAIENFFLKIGINLRIVPLFKNTFIVEMLAKRAFSYIPYTPIANMTGQPSMSVPLHWTPAGLPVGVMFTGRMCEENILFRLAAQLEEGKPWRHEWPVI
jgi:amidase